MENSTEYENELKILRAFYEAVRGLSGPDSTLSDSKLVKETTEQLRDALRGVKDRCTCMHTFGGICELCQASPREFWPLRNFFRVIRDAKENNWPVSREEIQTFIGTTTKMLNPEPPKRRRRTQKLSQLHAT